MKIFIMLWLVIGGQDFGGPPVEFPTMEACEKKAAEIRAIPVPEEADFVSVGCVTEMRPGKPT